VRIWIDIETLPADIPEGERGDLAGRSVPKHYKDPVKIQAWVDANADKAWRKTALRPWMGRILCIAAAADNGPIESWYGVDTCIAGLCDWLDALEGAAAVGRHDWAGWNVRFDLSFLRLHAARAHAFQIIRHLPRGRSGVVDVMDIVAEGQRDMRCSLGAAARFFGADKAEGMHGSEVYDAWVRGEHDRIERYCRGDVELVRMVGRRVGV